MNPNDVSGIDLEQHGACAWVTLRHAGKFNAMSRAMWRELRRVFMALSSDDSIRCIGVRGCDQNFCAGGDISEYTAFRFDETSLREFHEEDVWGGLQAMLACDLPIVAQIEGHCMGAGMELASCCDLRIAAESARFGAPIARLGFPMAPRETALVLREAGALSTRQMLLEAAVLDAAQMQQRGFLTRVLPDAQVAQDAQATVQRMATLAPQAARLNKRTLRALMPLPALDPSDLTAINTLVDQMPEAYAYASSMEHREGIAAFLEKRRAQFAPNGQVKS